MSSLASESNDIIPGINADLRESVRYGKSSIQFREYIKGVFSALDDLHASDYITDQQRIIMKVEMLESMEWLGPKLDQLEAIIVDNV